MPDVNDHGLLKHRNCCCQQVCQHFAAPQRLTAVAFLQLLREYLPKKARLRRPFRRLQLDVKQCLRFDRRECTVVGTRIGAYPAVRDAMSFIAKAGLGSKFSAGVVLGALSGLLASPFDLVRIRVQAEAGLVSGGVLTTGLRAGHPVRITGSVSSFRLLLQDGVLSIFRGSGVNVVRSICMTVGTVPVYEQNKLGPHGVGELLRTLPPLPQLRGLILAENQFATADFSPEVFGHLSEMAPALEELDLTANQLGSDQHTLGQAPWGLGCFTRMCLL
eukprot:Skav233367  [mRNA]  locus=scaffold394:610637:618214:+ [translate_table: standard]